MQVIAERDKRSGKFLLVLGLTLSGLSTYLLSISLWYILLLIAGFILSVFGIYCGLLLPKTAIERENDTLIIYFAFCKKQIAFSKIEYVSYHELGAFASHNGGGFFHNFYRFQNDIRTLTITTKENFALKHFYVLSIMQASATATTINSFIEQLNKTT